MASVLRLQKVNAAKAEANAEAKLNGKRKANAMDMDEDQPVKKLKNKQRVLMLSSRGINHRMRHLMNDLAVLLPHVKKGEWVVSYEKRRQLKMGHQTRKLTPKTI